MPISSEQQDSLRRPFKIEPQHGCSRLDSAGLHYSLPAQPQKQKCISSTAAAVKGTEHQENIPHHSKRHKAKAAAGQLHVARHEHCLINTANVRSSVNQGIIHGHLHKAETYIDTRAGPIHPSVIRQICIIVKYMVVNHLQFHSRYPMHT